MNFYAYIHARPDTENSSGVFYVGKGKSTRHKVLPARNRYHGFVLDKHGAKNILVGKLECSSEQIAFALEVGIIKCLKRSGVSLSNMTDGGDGTSGFKMPQEAKDKISRASKIMGQNPEIKARKSIATTALNNLRWSDPEYAEKTASAMRGKKKTRSEASDAARRANSLKSATPEAKAKKSAAAKEMWAQPGFRDRMMSARQAAKFMSVASQ